jgi:hypothetical protein
MGADTKKISATARHFIPRIPALHPFWAALQAFKNAPGVFVSVSPVNKDRTQNEERPTIDINDLFDGIMKSINQSADEIAEQRLQEKMQESGRDPENGDSRKADP